MKWRNHYQVLKTARIVTLFFNYLKFQIPNVPPTIVNYWFYLQMDQLELKLARELPSSAKVVACRFPFPNWVPQQSAGEGIDTVWVYDAKTFRSLMSQGREGKNTSEHGGMPDSHTWIYTPRFWKEQLLKMLFLLWRVSKSWMYFFK